MRKDEGKRKRGWQEGKRTNKRIIGSSRSGPTRKEFPIGGWDTLEVSDVARLETKRERAQQREKDEKQTRG